MSSESSTVLPLKSISAGCAGVEPVAITMPFAETRRSLSSRPSIASVCASTNRAQPSNSVTWFRSSWSRITSPLGLDDVARAHGDVVDRDALLEAVALAVDRALVQPGEVEDRLADRLRRDRAGVDARTAQRRRDARRARRSCRASPPGSRPSARPVPTPPRRGRTRSPLKHGNVGLAEQCAYPLVHNSRVGARRRSPSSPGRRRSREGPACRPGTALPGPGSPR